MVLSLLILIALLAVAYAFARPWLLVHSARWEAFCAGIDPLAAKLWRNSRTILISRIYWIAGALVGIHDALAQTAFAGLDWTPIGERFLSGVPQDLHGIVLAGATAGTGLVFEWLRKVSTGPVAT